MQIHGIKLASLALGSLMLLAGSAHARTVDGRWIPARVQNSTVAPGVTTNKQLVNDGDTWAIQMTNKSGLNYRCEVIGKIGYKNLGVSWGETPATCVLQTVRVKASVTNAKYKLKSRASLDKDCRVPLTGVIQKATVTRIHCEQLANEEGDPDAVDGDEDTNPAADIDAIVPSIQTPAEAANAALNNVNALEPAAVPVQMTPETVASPGPAADDAARNPSSKKKAAKAKAIKLKK